MIYLSCKIDEYVSVHALNGETYKFKGYFSSAEEIHLTIESDEGDTVEWGFTLTGKLKHFIIITDNETIDITSWPEFEKWVNKKIMPLRSLINKKYEEYTRLNNIKKDF